MTRQDYNYWDYPTVEFPVELRITSIYDSVVYATINKKQAGKVVNAQAQFSIDTLEKVGPECCTGPNTHEIVYQDGKLGGVWFNSSYNCDINFKSTNSPHSGQYCIESDVQLWGGLQFLTGPTSPTNYFNGVEFYIRSSGVCDNCLSVSSCDGNVEKKITITSSQVNQWVKISAVGMKETLGYGDNFNKICIKSIGNVKAPKFWIDDFRFTKGNDNPSNTKCYVESNIGKNKSSKTVTVTVVVVIICLIAIAIVLVYLFIFRKRDHKSSTD